VGSIVLPIQTYRALLYFLLGTYMPTKKPKHHKNKGNASRTLVLAALMTSGMLQPILPASALGTAPGDISNTATATYSDGTNTFNATSNTVKVTVAEVAGLLVAPAGIKDIDGGAVQAGDTLNFDFQVSNTGNAPTDIFIPALGDITANYFTPTAMQYAVVAADGTIGSFVNMPPGGIISGVPTDGRIIVRVTGDVPTSGISAGAQIRVTLGDTLPNDNSPATQNQPDVGATGDVPAKDVRTQNVGPETPIDGEREASATQFIPFATQVKPLALATLKKDATNVTANTAANTDDQITYSLNLTVENTSPSGSFSAEKLAATDIKLSNSSVKKILVSDIIPTGTVFDPSVAPVAPDSNWTVVYSTDDPATTVPVIANGGLPAANWTTTQPLTPASIKRIGYIYNPTTPLPANGTPITGFKFTVVTSGVSTQGASVYNVAQVFGQTYDDPANPVNPTTEVVYDESGDNNPNNFNDDQTPPDNTGSNFDPTKNTGVANPGLDGVDPGGNTGLGPNGELTKVNIGSVAAAIEDIFNGPFGQPGATGPIDANDDFTNVSTAVSAGQQTAFDPATVTVKHTVQNPATNTVPLVNVTIEPISPTQAVGADSNGTLGKFGSNASIPNGTIVTIKYDANGNGSFTDPGDQVAVYTYNSTNGVFVIATGTKPVNVGELAPGASVNYVVDINLPLDANLTKPLSNVPIPILAFSDDDPINSPGYNGTLNIIAGNALKTPELNNNVTNDNVYLGFMELVKEARILSATGVVLQDWAKTFTLKAHPGDVIEYRIKYKNTSTPMQGSGNVVLNAGNFSILEDGGAVAVGDAPANNWATSTTHQPTTQFDRGTVDYFAGVNSANPLGQTDPAANSQVGTYRNNVGTVAPGALGEFIFRRQVNK
jgi:hypothetical protein